MNPGPLDQGVSSARYTVIPRVLCFLRHGPDVLLLKGAPDKPIWPHQYNGLGGHVERDEEPYQAARREIREEAGLEVPELRLGGLVHVSLPSGPGVLLFVFVGEAPSRQTRPSREGRLEWVPPARVADLPTVADLPILLSRLLEAGPGDPPFFARSYYDEAGQLQIEFS
ncbi:MAG: NUDIX domain-containing protein [Chloroflexia bacterium]|nr:NUDIX domain-containing protein [Chloroflexia bacterium]